MVVLAALVADNLVSLRKVCEDTGVAELAVFGSATRPDFGEGSDVDMIVQFKPGHRLGLLGLAALQITLGDLLGRPVDLVTPNELHPRIRDRVLKERTVIYAG
jgi:predicted nucleotidyltransferase